MLKVGDKLLCKNTKNIIKKNKYYIIFNIDNTYSHQWLLLQYKNVSGRYDWYSSNPKNHSWYIWDYFYTTQEVRKLKLKQLNESMIL